MKKIIPLLIVFFITSCGTQKNGFKLKTLKTKSYTINYPANWFKVKLSRGSYFIPKQLKVDKLSSERNRISINNIRFNTKGYDNIEKLLLEYANSDFGNQKTKTSKLIKINNNSNFMYKIESVIEYKSLNGIYKIVEFFYKIDDKVQRIEFQMREDLFDKYINEAMLIINSFEPK